MTISRRDAMTTGAAVAAAAMLPATEAFAQTVIQRPNVSTLAPNNPILVSYRTAINAMKALPQSDPRNWTRQAQIHLNNCPHGNWFFLPWHRAYLLGFERICRQLSGNPNFALPYWDWTANPQLPAAFASQLFNGQPNALFNNTRSSQTVTIPNNVAGSQRMATILAETTFEIFASTRPNGQNSTSPSFQRANGIKGPFESGPHDTVHVRIDGDMRSFLSPLDPIFWLHHCNIDRIWDQWNRMGRANTTNTLWRNFAFNGQFVTPQGAGTTPLNVTVSGLLNIQTLGYRYVPPIFFPGELLVAKPAIDLSRLTQVSRVEANQVARINTPLSLDVRLQGPQAATLKRIQPIVPLATEGLTRAPRPVQASGRILAILRDILPPANGNTEVRVFVNLPTASAETPTEDPHYAGSFTFFGLGEHASHGGSGQSILFDLTETVRRLRATDTDVSDNIRLQLVPVPIPGVPSANLEFKIGSIEIATV